MGLVKCIEFVVEMKNAEFPDRIRIFIPNKNGTSGLVTWIRDAIGSGEVKSKMHQYHLETASNIGCHEAKNNITVELDLMPKKCIYIYIFVLFF